MTDGRGWTDGGSLGVVMRRSFAHLLSDERAIPSVLIVLIVLIAISHPKCVHCAYIKVYEAVIGLLQLLELQ